MLRGDPKGRRDFIKTTALAGLAAALPAAGVAGRGAAGANRPEPEGRGKTLLFLSDNPQAYAGLIGSLESPPNGLRVSPFRVQYQNPEEILRIIHAESMDILLMCLAPMTFSFGSLYDSMGDLDVPVIVLSTNPELIPIDANLVASLRANGAEVSFALSEDQALGLVKHAAAPGMLEGRRAVVFGRPFDSTTVPAHNLTEEQVRRRTGVRMQFRPIEELAALFEEVDPLAARGEMERWKNEAAEVTGVSDDTILDACRLYVALRSLAGDEGLDAVSIDCLGFTLSPKPVLPYPCLAFARLRDEGITAACEADICGMLSSMFLEAISRRPSFMCNLMSLDMERSKITLSHCVAPTRLHGRSRAPAKYRIHDYHGFGRGAVPEVAFPLGGEVLTGGFLKDLKGFLLWPGRIRSQVTHTDRAAPAGGRMLNVCANTIDVGIRDAGRFLQNIPGLHQVLILGTYSRAIEDALFGMHMKLVGPSDFTPPEA